MVKFQIIQATTYGWLKPSFKETWDWVYVKSDDGNKDPFFAGSANPYSSLFVITYIALNMWNQLLQKPHLSLQRPSQ